LFLDEPTLGLDVQTRTATWGYIKRLKEEFGMTLFMTTHYLEEADNLCDRIAIIDNGKIVALDTPNALKESLGGDIISITIEQNDADPTRLIEKTSKVKEVKKQDNTYRVKVENGEEVAPQILNKLTDEGYKVTRLSLTKPTLDEVYLEYTGRSMRAEESSGDMFTKRIMMRRARQH
jgi:ABC-2 type transport system ATP-binding protein